MEKQDKDKMENKQFSSAKLKIETGWNPDIFDPNPDGKDKIKNIVDNMIIVSPTIVKDNKQEYHKINQEASAKQEASVKQLTDFEKYEKIILDHFLVATNGKI